MADLINFISTLKDWVKSRQKKTQHGTKTFYKWRKYWLEKRNVISSKGKINIEFADKQYVFL